MRRLFAFVLLAAIAAGAQAIPRYRRGDWPHWSTQAGGCNTRQAVLIRDSRVPVTKRAPCTVLTGEWFDPYSGETFRRPQALDLDHVVPLGNSHISGGWRWDRQRKQEYANDLTAGHLLLVKASLNRQKGDKSPDRWTPPRLEFLCEYGQLWDGIKERWGLTMTGPERAAVSRLLATCPN